MPRVTYFHIAAAGPWAFALEIGQHSDRRKRITRTGSGTKSAATAARREYADLAATDVPVHRLTVGEYLDAWIDGKHALKPSTRSHYRDAIRLFLRPPYPGVSCSSSYEPTTWI